MSAINHTHKNRGEELVINWFVSGNGISTVNSNGMIRKDTDIVRGEDSTVTKIYTITKNTNCSSFGCNIDNNTYYNINYVIINKEKIYNLKKLDQISYLKDDWNGNDAKAFDFSLINKVRSVITVLQIQPELFPTACNSIQLEYEKKDGSYLEIEATLEDKWEVFEIDNKGAEKIFYISSDINSIIKMVDMFYE